MGGQPISRLRGMSLLASHIPEGAFHRFFVLGVEGIRRSVPQATTARNQEQSCQGRRRPPRPLIHAATWPHGRARTYEYTAHGSFVCTPLTRGQWALPQMLVPESYMLAHRMHRDFLAAGARSLGVAAPDSGSSAAGEAAR